MAKRALNPHQMAFMDNPVLRPAAQRTRKPRFRGEIPGQLAMLMSGTQLHREITKSYDAEDHENLQMMWDRKLRESSWPVSSGQTLYDSMREHGFKFERDVGEGPATKSIRLFHDNSNRFVLNHHHRIASAAEIERQGGEEILFPVEHKDWKDQLHPD